ncbi:MAG: hypothetical protein H6752_03795 [Candidatus Omnitrophica bacterium]|nr:hypothetical protein [Candidatus Omnitrophota bacterium]
MAKKKKKRPEEPEATSIPDKIEPAPERSDPFRGIPLRWILLVVIVLAVLSTRLYSLGSQGFHHDESIHCLHSWQVANQGPQTYRYNPVYHGPFLYHWGGLFHFFSQLEPQGEKPDTYRFYHHLLPDRDWVGRVPYALMGVFLILIFIPLGKHLGWGTVFLIMGFLTLSPVVDYFSRFARNDVYQTAWLSGSIVCGYLYFFSKKARYLTLVALFMTLCYCTKENSYMNNFVLCSFVILWGVFELIRSPKATLERIAIDYAPLVRFLILFGCFSFFVFLFVALDSRVSPETGLGQGVRNILSHSTALTEKIDASGLKRETGYFTAAGREATRAGYYRLGFATVAILMTLFEILVLLVRRRVRPEEPIQTHLLRLVLSLIFIASLIASGVLVSKWISSAEKDGFITALFSRAAIQILVFAILASLFLIPNRMAKREGKRLLGETFEWVNLGVSVVIAQTVYLFLFTSMGTNVKKGASSGLYDYISYWFKHQTGDFRIWGAWWYYLPRLLLYELFPLVVVLVVGIALLFRVVSRLFKKTSEILEPTGDQESQTTRSESSYWKRIPTPFLAFGIYQFVFMLVIYAILNEKVPWLLTYQSFALNLLAGLLIGQFFATHPNTPGPFLGFFWDLVSPKRRLSWLGFGGGILVTLLLLFLIPFAVGQHLAAVFVRPDHPTELLLYTGTTNQFAAEMERIRGMREEARKSGEKLKIAVDGKSEWPSAWYFRNDQVRWKTIDLTQDIQILDNTSANQRKMKQGNGKVWEIHPVDLRGWWIWHGTPKALPGELAFLPNLEAFLENTRNDKRQFFPKDERPEEEDYVVGFRDQVLRYVFGRRIWYPTGGEKVLVCYKTDEDIPADEVESFLEGVTDRTHQPVRAAAMGGGATGWADF